MYVARELSKDMDMNIYNRMLQIQNNPKYSHYFSSSKTLEYGELNFGYTNATAGGKGQIPTN